MTAIEQTRPMGLALGLSEEEAAARRARGEGNIVPVETSRSYKRILLQNTFTFINVVLYVISILLLILGLYGDAAMTALLVVANVIIGVFQEARAKRQLDRIALLTRPTATVIRDSRERTIDPGEIVRGDVLVVQPGDQVLVDGEILQSSGMTVDESLLTGESDVVVKQRGDTLHSGSFCMTGSARFEARQVGANSFAQQITGQARAFRDVQTPLQREVGLILQVIGVLVFALAVQIAISYRHGLPLSESVQEVVQAAAVLVSLVPQGLVFMVAITYAMAAVRLAGKGALIQRMNAVESTSHINVLCLDKTGTLTTNQLKLEAIEPFDGDEATLRALLGDFVASGTTGNRTTQAIAAACGGQARTVREEAAFSSARKWSGIAFDDPERRGVYVLGAPEILGPALRAGAQTSRLAANWTARGLRVLLFAHRPDLAPLKGPDGEPRLPSDLIPLCAISLSDELRPEAQDTIARFAEAGIALKIISGDNPDTVAALAKQAGFARDIRAVSGLDLDGLNDTELRDVASSATIFGRIAPQQKERLVTALRGNGHYVAMIGDGVNDVLALKRADLAIAMRSGSQVTRGIADIVLIDDSFAVLPAAFREGQRILRGMQDIIRLFLIRALYVALIIFGTSLLGEAFPITPKHNGLLAFLTVGIPVFALAAWARPGTTPRRLALSSGNFIVPAAVSIAIVGLMVYLFYLSGTNNVLTARSALTTTTILSGLVLIPFAQPPNEAFVGGSDLNGDWRPTALAAAMVGLYVAVLATPWLRNFYGIQVLSVPSYFIITMVVLGWAVALRFAWRLDVVTRVRALSRRTFGRRRAVTPS